jgi:hypothetical protein
MIVIMVIDCMWFFTFVFGCWGGGSFAWDLAGLRERNLQGVDEYRNQMTTW